MKRSILMLILLIAVAMSAEAQIPNNGFENWTTAGTCLQPKGWACINDWMGSTENCYSMSRSTDHYPASVGSYSIKIENTISIWPDYGAAGLVWTGDSTGFGTDNPAFPITGHPTSLCGYFKFIPEFGDTMDIHFALYKNGMEVTSGRLTGNASVSEWTPFIIPVTDPEYSAADSARIMMSSFFADHFIVYGNSVLYVDNLSFDNLISSTDDRDSQSISFNLSPDPAGAFVMLNFNSTFHERIFVNIYSPAGVLIKSALLDQDQKKINISDLSEGIYVLAVKSKDMTGRQKLIIQR